MKANAVTQPCGQQVQMFDARKSAPAGAGTSPMLV
jgi:hypothetical protein